MDNRVPEIRFKEFSGEWIKEKIANIAPLQRGFDLPKNEMKAGEYPVVMSNGVNGFHNIFKSKAPGVVTGRSGTIGNIHYVDVDYWPHNTALWVTNFHGNEPRFVYYLYVKLDLKRFGTGSGVPTLNRNDVHDQSVALPKESEEQTAIGNAFQKLDALINQHQQKHDKLSNIKKAMLEKLFPKQGETIPEIRFKGFSGEWEEKVLGGEMTVTSVKRIHQSDWTTSGVRFLRARDIVSAYKNEMPADCLYIAKEKYKEYSQQSGKVEVGDLLVTGVGTIGVPMLITDDEPVYFKDGNIIWFKNENKIDGMFLFYSFVGDLIQTYIKHSAGTGTVGTYTISSGKNTPIKMPTRKEQTAIGNYFQKLDTLINQHQQQITKLNNIKQACLSKMFV